MSSSASAFSGDGVDVIHRILDATKYPTTEPSQISQMYETERCTKWINQNQFAQVSLQFPDELLADSHAVCERFKQDCSAHFFILGDTSYGSCCVDEVAAQHNAADCIIHYGRSCLSQTTRLPVLYVFGQKKIDIDDCHAKFCQHFPLKDVKVIAFYDVVYLHAIEKLKSMMTLDYNNFVVSSLNANFCEKVEDNSSNKHSTCIDRYGRKFYIDGDISDYKMFYIGDESLTLSNLVITYNRCQFFSYNPETKVCRLEDRNVNRSLMRRFFMIEKAKDAKIVGIVVGTLGVKDYLTIIYYLKDILKTAGKKSYTFVMGKLNVAKMANFLEIDVFVLVSCPENSLIDSKEFYRPIVTPYEMEMACNRNREWSGEYITDFQAIIPGGSNFVKMSDSELVADVSLVTGGVRVIGCNDAECDDTKPNATDIIKRGSNEIIVHSHARNASEYLASRSWQGVEQKLGETEVVKAVEGRCGIAAGYDDEIDNT